jgi:hypothetical protein
MRTVYSKREAVAILSGKFCMLFDLFADTEIPEEVLDSLFDQSAAILGWQ